MIHTLALLPFFGLPMVVYGGMFTFLLMVFTATVGLLNFKKPSTAIPFKWHPRLAIITITLAILHALFGLSIFLGF